MGNLVSILIPVYNRYDLIEETIKSAINQDYQNIEVIVIDNFSDDGTWDLLKIISEQDHRIKIFQNKKNIGPVLNWKKGVEFTKGDFVKILWSDDKIDKNFISNTVPLLKNNNVAFVCTGVEHFTTGDYKKKINFFDKDGIYSTNVFIERALLGGNISVSASCALFRRSDLINNIIRDIPNKIESDFSKHAIGPDALMFLLTCNTYNVFAYINENKAKYRIHDNSISVATKSHKLESLHLIARAYFVENYVTDRKLIKRFNTRLLMHIIKYHNELDDNLNTIASYYYNNTFNKISYNYFIKVYFKRFFNKIKRLLS